MSTGRFLEVSSSGCFLGWNMGVQSTRHWFQLVQRLKIFASCCPCVKLATDFPAILQSYVHHS